MTDLERILATRHHNGGDFWTSPEGKIGVGGPFSTIEALLILNELDISPSHEAVQGASQAVLDSIQPDGRVKVAPKGTVYPCHCAIAAAALCRSGYGKDKRVVRLIQYLLENRSEDGGWRCSKVAKGKSPETDHSNPGVTLWVLDAFRCLGMQRYEKQLETAVESLLHHWTVRRPLGPCRFGIGTQFLQVEYPFLRYNIFYFAYVLSFYRKACMDKRFGQVLEVLKGKLDDDGRVVVERPNRKLAELDFCKKGSPSEHATRRYQEILKNCDRNRSRDEK